MNYRKILTCLNKQHAFYNTKRVLHSNPKPVKLAFVSYEDTATKDVTDVVKNPPLLIMHGLFGSKGNWGSICKALQRHTKPPKKIIAVDARNHGESPHSNEHTYQALAMDVKALLEEERIPKVAFLGHSMGGRVGMYLALQFPILIERLIVADISPVSNSSDFTRMNSYFGALASVKMPPKGTLSSVRATADAALMAPIPNKLIRSFLLTNLVQNSSGSCNWRINLNALRDNYANIARFPIEPQSGIRYLGPTTFIAGEASDYINRKDHEDIVKLFPNAKIFTIPQAGHWLHSEKPAEFLDIVLKALNNEPQTK